MGMAKIVLVTGGGRSGKSSYAERLAEQMTGPHVFLATAVPFDDELKERVLRHRESRAGKGWTTVEEPLALARALRECPSPATVLVDCLTLWVNNLLWQAQPGGGEAAVSASLSEEQVAEACHEVLAACRAREGVVLFVTNEVGLGIIPADPNARLYRDLLGRCNQVMASAADAVVFLLSGLPLVLKNDGVLPGNGRWGRSGL
jgi:adenosylcobinamide kinase/adenosylcobinamide-phosphate guanylyltransferase